MKVDPKFHVEPIDDFRLRVDIAIANAPEGDRLQLREIFEIARAIELDLKSMHLDLQDCNKSLARTIDRAIAFEHLSPEEYLKSRHAS